MMIILFSIIAYILLLIAVVKVNDPSKYYKD